MCKAPIKLTNVDTPVKCGRCIECLMQKSYEWATRLDIESKHAKTGVFLTLTYREEKLPVISEHGEIARQEDINDNDIWWNTLRKSDFQKFMKSLRKRHHKTGNKDQVRYFMCGEYGSKTKRAHYHALVFNLDRSLFNKIDEIWSNGFVVVGEVTPKSIRYVSNYMLKKDVQVQKPQLKPYTSMSLKPAIGHQYIDSTRSFEQHMIYEQDEMLVPGKTKPNINNYFLDKLTDPLTAKRIKDKRLEKWQEAREKRMDEAYEGGSLDPIGEYKKSRKLSIEEKERKFNKYKKTNKL